MNTTPFGKYQKSVDQLPTIAKAVILAAVLGLIFMFWHQVFWTNIHKAISTKNNKIMTLKSAIPPLETKLRSLNSDMQTILKTREEEHKKGETASHIKVRTMLYELLKDTNDLTLVELKNIPPPKTGPSQISSQAVEHNIAIKFMGNYFSTIHYLQSIEKLPWKIFWDKLEYKVTAYPTAEVTLFIHAMDNGGTTHE